MKAYCVKCKEKREFTGHVEETNGRRFAKGICPVCGADRNAAPCGCVTVARDDRWAALDALREDSR